MARITPPTAPVPPAKPGAATRAVAPFVPLALALVAGQAFAPPTTGHNKATPPVAITAPAAAPVPLLKAGQPVDWWFVFKFNAESFPDCSGDERSCPFGGTVQDYQHFSQQFAFASSTNQTLQKGSGCAGESTVDPVGATFNEVYNGHYFYVLWNDQFYGDPINSKSSPAGHSKGMLAWDSNGDGLVLQVSTPSWPASGNPQNPRKTDGNTLGCIKDNDVMVSQHFFSLRLTKQDVLTVLAGLANASVVTQPADPQIVNNGGPADIQAAVGGLGKNSKNKTAVKSTLSSGVMLISKPSNLQVPPWQMVSAMLGSEPLRVASWYTRPEIPSTTKTSTIGCWDTAIGTPGPVEIATSGAFAGVTLGLEGMPEPQGNHAKVGVSMASGTHAYSIFGDMNQQGALSGKCDSSQNGRGGLFYVVDNATLANSVRDLIKGDSAPTK